MAPLHLYFMENLWSGNYLIDQSQKIYLIDPAIYYGDKEADIAMTKLFGGFPQAFYEGYYTLAPFHKDIPKREKIYNLYHLLNHYNLFGTSYLEQTRTCFKYLSDSI